MVAAFWLGIPELSKPRLSGGLWRLHYVGMLINPGYW